MSAVYDSMPQLRRSAAEWVHKRAARARVSRMAQRREAEAGSGHSTATGLGETKLTGQVILTATL